MYELFRFRTQFGEKTLKPKKKHFKYLKKNQEALKEIA